MATATQNSPSTKPRSDVPASDHGSRLQESDGQNCESFDGVVCALKDYAKARPDVAALWCFGIGFVLGWKLRPW